jgi:peroxiredoxin
MTVAGWIVVALFFALVLWLGFAMIALVRTQAGLRARIEDLEASITPVRIAGGLPVGRTAPDWAIATDDGGSLAASSLAGTRHVLVFADATCAACDEVVPAVIRAAEDGDVPPVVVIGRDGDELPASWIGPRTGLEHADEVSAAFLVEVSPHVFVIDEGGAIVAQGGAASLEDVEALVREGQGIQVLPGADDA